MSNIKSGSDCVPGGTVAPTTWLANMKSHFGVCLSSESGLRPEFQHHPNPPNWMTAREFPESYPPLAIFKSTFEMYFKYILSYLPWYFVIQFSSVAQSCPTLCDHLILCHHIPLLPSIFPSIRVFSNESVLRIRWPKYWSFSFSISPSSEHPGLISFRIDFVIMPWLISTHK